MYMFEKILNFVILIILDIDICIYVIILFNYKKNSWKKENLSKIILQQFYTPILYLFVL